MGDLPLLPVAPWNREGGYWGHLTPQQEAALGALRHAFPVSMTMHTDHDMLRFLRAREFSVEETIAMYAKYLTVV